MPTWSARAARSVGGNLKAGARTPYPPTAEMFPACKHFFPCMEVAGSTTLRDVIGGVVLKTNLGSSDSAVTQAISKPDAYSIAVPSVSGNQKLVSGSWTTIGTSTVTALVVADFDLLGYFGFGDGSAGETEIVVRGYTVGPSMNDGSTNVIATACTDAGAGVVYAAGCTFDFGGNAVSFQTDSAGAYSANAPVAMGALASLAVLSRSTSIASAPSLPALYGAAMFVWAGAPPSDFALAIPWMVNAWKNGTKAIYPGWVGKT